ncbi:MAG: hypothetical protein KAQ75_02495, partial [Bacteroidales bacterium]|nr:hypothetical protein [Bacteroidales bacterium]
MKQIKQYGIFLFLLVIFTSCSNREKNNDFTLDYWSSSNNSEIKFSKILVEKWNSLHPNEKIQ